MALVKNQYGTFYTDKSTGTPRIPVTSKEEKLAQRLYGKSFDELTVDLRTKIRTGKFIKDSVTYEQYLDEFKKMANDPSHIPKYIKPAKGEGLSAQRIRARNEAKNTIENFEAKYNKNINRRKRLKRASDPIKKEQDLIKKAERRVKRRLKKKDVALTADEAKINLDQRKLTRELNNPIRNNPKLILNNKNLMDRLSITVSKDGDIVKLPAGLTEKYLSERGLFEIDHQRDIFKKGRGKNLPYNRNLIMGPHNRTGGFKEMAEKYIQKNPNPNDPKVKRILEVADELKITLQPDIPAGIFKTKGIGYKQLAHPLDKFKEVGGPILNESGIVDIEKIKTLYKSEQAGSPLRKYLEKNIAHCADGCFIKVANANPERIAKKLSEDPKLIRLFRGEEPSRTGIRLSRSGMYSPKLKDRFFFDNPADARWYAQRAGTLTGNVKSVDVPEKYVNIGRKISERRRGPKYGSEVVLPKKFVGKETLNIPQTALARAVAVKDKLKKLPGITYDKVKGAFVNTATDDVVSQAGLKTWADDNPMPVKVGEAKPGVLRKIGKAVAHVGLPLPTAAMDAYFIGREIEEGKSPEEIARNPLNWLGLATMDPLTKAAGMAEKSGKLASVMRLGMSPGMIRGATRFLGLPGLALSTGLTAYDQYQKYKNKEGFVYDLFNPEEIDNARV